MVAMLTRVQITAGLVFCVGFHKRFQLRPILMQLDLQSVDKSTFQNVGMSFCPENVGNWSSSPQNKSELSPRSIQSCVPLLQGPRNGFFDPMNDCTVIVFDPVGLKK